MIELFDRGQRPALIGVVHLLPLPGSPAGSPGLAAVCERARADARALRDNGADAVIVENLGDAPFTGGSVDPFTVAAMTRIALVVRDELIDQPLGINVLRNDAHAALAIAATVSAQFIRVNVHVGAMLTDQGVITGDARGTLLERNRIGAPTRIAADVLVKHAVPLAPTPIDQAARDTLHRGRADALIVTGAGTGLPLDPADLERVRAAVPNAPLWAGSGVTPDNAPLLRNRADAAIVGTWLHDAGDLGKPLDASRIRAMQKALAAL